MSDDYDEEEGSGSSDDDGAGGVMDEFMDSYDPDDLDDEEYEDAIGNVQAEAEAEWTRRGTDPNHPHYDPKFYDIVNFDVDKMFELWEHEDEEEAEEHAALGENMMVEKMELAKVAREARLIPIPELHEVQHAFHKKRKATRKALVKSWAATTRALEPKFIRLVRQQREHHERVLTQDGEVRAFKASLAGFVAAAKTEIRRAKGEETNRRRKLKRAKAKMDLELSDKTKESTAVRRGVLAKLRKRRQLRHAAAKEKEDAAQLDAAERLARERTELRTRNIKMFSDIAESAGREAEALKLAIVEDRAAMVAEKAAAQDAESSLHNKQTKGFRKLGPAPLMATRDDVDRVAMQEAGGVIPGWSAHDMEDRLLPGGVGAAYAALPNASDDSVDIEDDDIGDGEGFDREEVMRLGRGVGSDAPLIHLAGTPSQYSVERSNAEVHEIEAKLARMEREYLALQAEQGAAAEEEEVVQDRRVRMRNSRAEAIHCESALRARLRGPPPRMPSGEEKIGSLYRSSKILRLTKLDKQLLKRLHSIARERSSMALREMMMARDLAQLRGQVAAAHATHAALVVEERSLPMVLGRAITVDIGAAKKSAGVVVAKLQKASAAAANAAVQRHGVAAADGEALAIRPNDAFAAATEGVGSSETVNKQQNAPPSEFHAPALAMEAVLMRSHLVLTTSAANDALALQTGIRKMDRKQWELREANLQLESEVEHGMSRLAAIKVAMGKNEDDYRRVALVRSIQRFHASGIKLHHVNALVTAPLNWWSGRSKPSVPHPTVGSAGRDEVGVILRDGHRGGSLEGSIDFPRHSLWAVSFIVTKLDVKAPRQGARLDHVTFSAGNSRSNVHQVTVVHNRRPAGNPHISHVVTHQIRGASLHYRFEWDSASNDESVHLVVHMGKCQEQKPKELEEVTDPATGKTWYVSSYVKLVRFEMSQGQGRFSRLLEELIRVEEMMHEDPEGSKTASCASDILHGHMQLFRLSQLHLELKEALEREGAAQEKARVAAERELRSQTGRAAQKADKRRQLVMEAKKRYMDRKSSSNNKVEVDTLEDIVGETIEIYRERDKMWRTAVVADLKVTSTDGGLSTQVLHLLEFVKSVATDESQSRLETVVWLNLTVQKFQVLASGGADLSVEARAAQEEREREANERKAAELEKVRIEKEEEAALVLEEDRQLRQLHEDFNAAEKEALAEAPLRAEDAAKAVIRSPLRSDKHKKVAKEIKQATFFIAEQTVQLAKEAGDDEAEADYILAASDAKEAYIAVKRREARLAEEAEWELRRENHQASTKELKAQHVRNRLRRANGAARRAREQVQMNATRIEWERNELRARMTIAPQIWSQAISTSGARPLDLASKRWTTPYSYGEKGRETGEELSTLHQSAAQQAGVPRPYANQGVRGIRARFNAAESEKQRVEKEMYDIDQMEDAIYESGNLLAVEEIRFRHGLEMHEDELQPSLSSKTKSVGSEDEENDAKSETQLDFPAWAAYPKKPRSNEVVFDGNQVQVWAHAHNGSEAYRSEFVAMAPQRYYESLSPEGRLVLDTRVLGLRHRVRFREMLDIAGRVQSFEKRVNELKKTEQCFHVIRRSVRTILVQRHRDIEHLERDQITVSNEHDLAEEMLRRREDAKKATIHAAASLINEEKAYVKSRAEWEQAEVDACQWTYNAQELEARVEHILEWRFDAEKAEEKAHSLLADAHAMTHAAEVREEESQWPILRWQFKHGAVVDTRFGRGRVVQYRASDEILVVELSWNHGCPFTPKTFRDKRPSFRVYLPVQSVVAREAARQATERVAMEAAEVETRAWTSTEVTAQKLARRGMEEEDVLQAKIKRVVSLNLLADDSFQMQLIWAEQMAMLDISMPDRKAELMALAFAEVTEAWAVRERERMEFRNEMRRDKRATKMKPLIAEKKERDLKAEHNRLDEERVQKRDDMLAQRAKDLADHVRQREKEEEEFQEMLSTLPPSQRDKVMTEHEVYLEDLEKEDALNAARVATEIQAYNDNEAQEILDRKREEKKLRKTELKRKKLEESAKRKEKELAKSEGRKVRKTEFEIRPDPPPVIGPWTQYKMRKAAVARMEEELVVKAKLKAADAISEHWERRRVAARENSAMGEVWTAMLNEIIMETAEEELVLEEQERQRAETRVGVVLTDSTLDVESRMPYSVYRPLVRMRQGELGELAVLLRALGYEDQAAREERRRVEMISRQRRARTEWLRRGYKWAYNMERMETILLDEAEFKRREKKQERIALVAMRREEKSTKVFYKAERKLFLQERWAMAADEVYMRDFMRRWDMLHAVSKYDVAGADAEEKGPTAQSERRAWLKKRGAERKLMKREIEFMTIEDELAHEIRAEEQHEIQLQMLRMEQATGGISSDGESEEDSQFELEDEMEDDEDDFDSLAHEQAEEHAMKQRGYVIGDETRDVGEMQWIRERKRRLMSRLVELPPINAEPDTDAIDGEGDTLILLTPWTAELARRVRALQRLAVTLKYKLRVKQAKGVVHNVLEILAANVEEAEIAAKMIVEDAVEVALSRRATLLTQENVWGLERAHSRAHGVVTRLIAHGQSVGAENTHARDVARRRRLRERELFRETFVHIDRLSNAKSRAKEMEHIWRLVESETRYFDSAALHMFDQRMKTADAAKKLYYLYFELIAQQVRSRAEVTVNERRMRVLDARSQQTAEEKRAKIIQLNRVRRERVQFDLMSLRRSVLGQRMFQKSRAKTLKRGFAGWREAWRWRLNIRSAFELRAKLAEQSAAMVVPAQGKAGEEPNSPPQSIMRRHQLKRLRCTHCKQPYQEATNHGEACAFHPGKFTFLCPRSCPHHKGKPAPTCMAHFRARWSCCDKSKNPPHDSNGCQRRWHRPAPDDEYRSNTDRAFMSKEDGESRRVAKEREVHKVEVASRQTQLVKTSKLAARLQADRKTAARWKALPGQSEQV